jgi:hypothetical protein
LPGVVDHQHRARLDGRGVAHGEILRAVGAKEVDVARGAVENDGVVAIIVPESDRAARALAAIDSAACGERNSNTVM